MQLRILHKMLLGYAFYLGIAFCFGVYVYTQIGQVGAKQKLVEIADDSKEKILELRRNEKNYIIRRDPVYLDKIHGIIPELKALIVVFKPDLVAALNERDYQTLTDAVKTYSSLMERFRHIHQETEALTAALRRIGRLIEIEIVATTNYKLIREILEIRLVEKNYILFMDEKYFHELSDKVHALQNDLGKLPDCAAPQCESYLRTARRLFDHNKREAALLTQIRAVASHMENIIATVAKRERQDISLYLAGARRLLLGGLLVLFFLGSLLTWLLARAMSSPIRRLEATVRQISSGNFDLRLDAKGDLETVSLQKSFNEMLDTLEVARESLEKTVHLLQEKGIQLIESEKLASIGILASGVAHEINNPLANISLTAETIRETAKDLSREELLELAADIVSQTERAATVVDSLLGYARSVKNIGDTREDVRDLVRQAVTLVAHELKLHDIELRLDLPDLPLMINGNKGKLEQVLVNLILNGVQAMGQSGILSIVASKDPGEKFAVVGVADTGPGIQPENLKYIFDPFFTTKSTGLGTGLGLYVSYGIMQQHGGDIEVESDGRQGALFRLRLPLFPVPEES